MLSVPDPHPNDPEGVVSALETAAIFGTQGDLKEAVRWVRKAAEIAGDEGNDERALTLARAVADLNISASQPPQPPPAPSQRQPPAPSAQQAPPPPPLPAAGATAYDPDGDAETRVVESAQILAEFQKQSNGNGAARAAPPLPPSSVSPLATPVAIPAEMMPVAAPVAYVDELPPPPPPPSAATVDTAPDPMREAEAESAPEGEESTPPSRRPVSSMAELLARKEAEVSSAIAAAEALQPEPSTWEDPPPPPPPPQASVPPVERRTAHPAAERVNTPLIPSQPYLERRPVNAPLHQAVRASVVATAEPGVFVLRVLTAAQPAAPTGHEVLVVVTNPDSSPFK